MPAKLQGDQQVRQGGAGGPGHQEQFNQDSSVPVSIFDQHFPLFSLTLNFSEQSVPDLLSTPAPLVWQETVQPDLLGRAVLREELHTEYSGAQAQYSGEVDVVNMANL